MPSLEIPQNLLVKCPKELPVLNNGNADEVALVMKDTASQYHSCATRNNGLIDAINEATK
jgi:hypothetical protein